MSRQPGALKRKEILRRLSILPGWTLRKKALVRIESFPDYLKALTFVYRLGHAAEKADHHPDITMNYKKVTVVYSTHSAGGVTELDFKMAKVADRLIEKGRRPQ